MMFGDTAQELITRATTTALANHEVGTVTMVVIVRNGDNTTSMHQFDCRPSERPAALAVYGININAPLRSPRHAYAWVDSTGRLNVGGTSEKGKSRLRTMYDALVMSGEDITLF